MTRCIGLLVTISYSYFRVVPFLLNPNFTALSVGALKYMYLSMEGSCAYFGQPFQLPFNAFYTHHVHVGLRSTRVGLS
jgi:hypothetical protein